MNSTGVFYGVQSFLQLAQESIQENINIPTGVIRDWPSVQERSLMLDTGRHYFSVEYIEYALRLMAMYKLNTFHFHLTDWSAFRLEDPVNFPGLAPASINDQSQSYSYQDIQSILSVADENHITVIPEIDVPGHSNALTAYYAKTHPGQIISFACPSMASYTIGGIIQPGWTIDVTNPVAVQYVENVIRNFMPWFTNSPHLVNQPEPSSPLYHYQGQYFHLGADEYPNNPIMQACPELIKACSEAPKGTCNCTKADGSLIPACQVAPGASAPEPVPGGLFVLFLDQLDHDLFVHTGNSNNSSHSSNSGAYQFPGKMRIWTGWNASSSPSNKYSSSAIDPNNDIAIDSWLITQDLSVLTKAGFLVNNASYPITYLTPGFASQNWDFPPPENYLLNTWQPNVYIKNPVLGQASYLDLHDPGFLGAGFQVWTDGAMEKTDLYFDTLLQRPLKLIANADWNGGQSTLSLDQFIQKLKPLEKVPGYDLPPPQAWCHPGVLSLTTATSFENISGFENLNNDLGVPWTLQASINLESGIVSQSLGSQSNFVLTQSDMSEVPGLNILQLDLVQSPSGSLGYMNGVANGSSPDSPVGSYIFNQDIPVDQWALVTYVGTHSGVKLYLNGQYINENNSVMSLPLKTFGQNFLNNQNNASAVAKNIIIANRALKPGEISENLICK